jgi:hypothetical protein
LHRELEAGERDAFGIHTHHLISQSKAIDGMLKIALGRFGALILEILQVIQNLILVGFRWGAVEMQGHGGQTTSVFREGTVTFTGNFYMSI